MGGFINRYCLQLGAPKYVILVGSTYAGKTTFLYSSKLRPGWDVKPIAPTLGFNYEEVNLENASFGVWDTSGDENLFKLTQQLYSNLKIFGVIYVIRLDSDPMTYLVAKRKLKLLAGEPALCDSNFAIVVNVADYSHRQFAEESYLKNALGFDELAIPEQNKMLFVQSVKSSDSEGSNPVWIWLNQRAI
mmetsp:Transcript_32165/g.55560  ORF Transcript_32165/g.55560 Transcript_32165/m.55560 type:complete len:189 (-) Transcript_32165:2563-3129(-)